MERKSPMLVISPWPYKALRNSPSARFRLRLRSVFLRSLAHLLAQRLGDFRWKLIGAAAESKATNATLEGGSQVLQEALVLGHTPLTVSSEGGSPGLQEAPVLGHTPLPVSAAMMSAASKSYRWGRWTTVTMKPRPRSRHPPIHHQFRAHALPIRDAITRGQQIRDQVCLLGASHGRRQWRGSQHIFMLAISQHLFPDARDRRHGSEWHGLLAPHHDVTLVDIVTA